VGEGKSIVKQIDLSLEEEDKFNLLITTFAFQQSIVLSKLNEMEVVPSFYDIISTFKS